MTKEELFKKDEKFEAQSINFNCEIEEELKQKLKEQVSLYSNPVKITFENLCYEVPLKSGQTDP
jgi:hypothetical protein